ncbi:Pre-mRNA-splicing factor cwc26 [Coemansia interrupta]|uniref:Pre-mRNA-splicing factor cwc26 n=1 Tax=Coemansia interrupta TaxID=1126814 RepID=A0A9W8LMK9_9FUNG|nr:Pre-mRNA-splicing factor cwc26 [Coemansia interrupta]
MSSLQDYLAKNYGSLADSGASDSAKKSKKKDKRKRPHTAASSYGANIVIADDDDVDDTNSNYQDMTFPALVSNASSSTSIKKSKRKKDKSKSSWDLAEAAAQEEADEHPVVAEGAELIAEYNLRREQEAAQLEAEKQRQRELRRTQALQAEAAAAQQPTSSLPEPEVDTQQQPMRYGLLTAQVVKEDSERARARHLHKLQTASPETSGVNAETVYRDPKTGKRIDIAQEAAREEEKQRKAEERRKMQREWNKGLVQQRAAAAPSDVDLDAERRAKEHWNDPARKFLENRKHDISKYPEYKGDAPANRFGIRPGYRWDGVDRSNGFEAEYFRRQAAASSRKAERYAYSVADL